MNALLRLSKAIDAINGGLGRLTAWAVVLAIVISAGNAVSRRFFGVSSNAWLELQWYLFGAVVMFCASWALREGAHVRIDVLSSQLSPRWRNRLDLFGLVAFLMPFTALMIWLSVPYARDSVLSGEISLNPGGLVIWPAKAMVLVGFVSLFGQGISEIVKRIAVMTGRMADATEPPGDGAGDAPHGAP